MKKYIVFFFAVFAMCVLFTACGIPKPPDEAVIKKNLPEDVLNYTIINPYDATTQDPMQIQKMSLVDMTIEKRQTNEKEDDVYCTVIMENEYYCVERKVRFDYSYYDEGGWLLDSWEDCEKATCDVRKNPLSEGMIKAAYMASDAVVGEVAVNEEKLNEIVYSYEIKTTYPNWHQGGHLIVTVSFDGVQWTSTPDWSQVYEQWDIVGNWEKFNDNGNGISIQLKSFDPVKKTATGTCTFYYPMWHILDRETRQASMVNDFSRAKISVDADSVAFSWGSMERVEFDFNTVSAKFFAEFSNRKIKNISRS